MVLKLCNLLECNPSEFVNDVEMYGTQTCPDQEQWRTGFENDVEMYGTQTSKRRFL